MVNVNNMGNGWFMGLSKERLKKIIEYIKSNTGNVLVIKQEHSTQAYWPCETVGVSDLFEILYAMKDNKTITYIELPPTPCSVFGESREKLIVPALIDAIKACAETNKNLIARAISKL